MELDDLEKIGDRERGSWKPCRIHCCQATGCLLTGGDVVFRRLQEAVGAPGVADGVQVVGVGCLGLCGRGPLVAVRPQDMLYERVTPDNAASIVEAIDGGQAAAAQCDTSQPFFAGQVKIACEYCGRIDPERIEASIEAGGYRALFRTLHELSPDETVAEIARSGLRGRGGAGYPTGLKWATVSKMPPGQKYVVCNADEGDPGAFMDRSIMEGDPHRVLEGMAIAGYAVGANQGYIYVRAEYPLATDRLRKAIQQASRLGLLGTGIFSSPFNFRIDIRVGAGAFVCGEETALLASIEGRRGYPRPRPPYPAEKGLWDCPTLINNVETFANVAPIITRGGAWFASIGTEKSKGTKTFSLTGDIVNAGLIEVPMGTSLRYIVDEMGGGVPGGGQVKAVQTGGPSGGCIPAEHLETTVDYESLQALGSIMGSGGMIVMDQNANMVDVARFFMGFCKEESCGECVPCRVGTVQMHRLLCRVLERQATADDLALLESLCRTVADTSLCGLGQSAPNPTLSTLRYFRHEYEALLRTGQRDDPQRSLPIVQLVTSRTKP